MLVMNVLGNVRDLPFKDVSDREMAERLLDAQIAHEEAQDRHKSLSGTNSARERKAVQERDQRRQEVADLEAAIKRRQDAADISARLNAQAEREGQEAYNKETARLHDAIRQLKQVKSLDVLETLQTDSQIRALEAQRADPKRRDQCIEEATKARLARLRASEREQIRYRVIEGG